MNVDLAVQRPLHWCREDEYVLGKKVKPRVSIGSCYPVPDLPEFPEGFMVISSSESLAKCQFQVWSVREDIV